MSLVRYGVVSLDCRCSCFWGSRNLKRTLLIAIGCAVINGFARTYGQDANSEQEEFDARIEQQISQNYAGQYTAEKTGNIVRLTSIDYSYTALGHAKDLATEPLRAKFLALFVLDMDSHEQALNSRHKLAPFIKFLICEPDGATIGQAIVFRKDYADRWAIPAAMKAALDELDRETKRWIHAMEQSLKH
jgi:hypothetical protein